MIIPSKTNHNFHYNYKYRELPLTTIIKFSAVVNLTLEAHYNALIISNRNRHFCDRNVHRDIVWIWCPTVLESWIRLLISKSSIDHLSGHDLWTLVHFNKDSFLISISKFFEYGRYHEMPQKAFEGGFCHVMVCAFFFEMLRNRRISFSAPPFVSKTNHLLFPWNSPLSIVRNIWDTPFSESDGKKGTFQSFRT